MSIVALIAVMLTGATALFLLGVLVQSIRKEQRGTGFKNAWNNFGLSIALALLFLVTWIAQGLSEWQQYVNDQQDHRQPAAVGEFITQFAQSTTENWQSEFLQLFTIVVLGTLLIHRGSSESRDSQDRIENKLDEIRQQLKKG